MPFCSISRRLRLVVRAATPDRTRIHPRLELLEDRTLLSVFTVTDTSDSASDPGSLCAVINTVNADPVANGPDQIVFASNLSAPTISLLSPLPHLIRGQVSITGPNTGCTLDGTSAGVGDGLDISGNGDSIQALLFENFQSGSGVSISGTGTSIPGDWFIGNGTGISVSGHQTTITDSQIAGNTNDGIDITGWGNAIGAVSPLGIGHNYQGGNWIAGNGGAGVSISGTDTTIQLLGNLIGTDLSGYAPDGNGTWGVVINDATAVSVGGSAFGAGNVISANLQGGVEILNGGGNVLQGNYIGTTLYGLDPLGNAVGISIHDSPDNLIGATGQDGVYDAREANVIGGNTGDGIDISGPNAQGNAVTGDLIGLNVSGYVNLFGTSPTDTVGLGNGGAGVSISDGAVGNIIGVSRNDYGYPASADQRNIISDNGDIGVDISIGASSNLVAGNLVGTDGSGTQPLGNKVADVLIDDAPDNLIGSTLGDSSGIQQNVIAGSGIGVEISGSTATGNVVADNLIGLNVDSSGTPIVGLGNGIGVGLDSGAWGNTIGVYSATHLPGTWFKPNVISGNGLYGVEIIDSGTTGNVVAGNLIGTDPTGTMAVGNGTGVYIGGARTT